MKLGALLKMGAFLISGDIFDKVEENEMIGLGEGWPRKFLRHLLMDPVSGKSSFQKFNGTTKLFTVVIYTAVL
jgi:hypothetical protein